MENRASSLPTQSAAFVRTQGKQVHELPVTRGSCDFDELLVAVAERWGVSIQEIKGRRRIPQFVVPRHVVYYFCYMMPVWYIADKAVLRTCQEIGEKLDGRDPTTISHGVIKIRRRIAVSPRFRVRIEEICRALRLSSKVTARILNPSD